MDLITANLKMFTFTRRKYTFRQFSRTLWLVATKAVALVTILVLGNQIHFLVLILFYVIGLLIVLTFFTLNNHRQELSITNYNRQLSHSPLRVPYRNSL